MGNWLLELYHRLPPSTRSIVASARGAYLRSWRFGRDTQRLMDEALERETWSDARWQAWLDERLTRLLHRAATQVPYYRAHWAERRRRGDRASWELLENWPLLEKDALRAQPEAFLADGCDPQRMRRVQTSGSTGKPLQLWRGRETVRALYALSAARTRGWHGVQRGDRYAMLGGQMVTPTQQRTPPFWVWNASLQQLYMSTFHLAPDLIPYYLDALARYRIVYLFGFTSALHLLAQEALRRGRGDLRMRVVITNAEPLSPEQREVIEAAFQCPVRETYGMVELVTAASECEAGQLHAWPEVGWTEYFEGETPVPRGEVGDLVCTGGLNTDMPLIRYRVGDRGRAADLGGRCSCGRSLPLVSPIDGRSTDVLLAPDGRRVISFGPVFYGLPVRQGQIIQEALDRIRVRYVSEPEFSPSAARVITERLHARLGAVEVCLEAVPEIPRGPNGKFRSIICQLPEADRRPAPEGRLTPLDAAA